MKSNMNPPASSIPRFACSRVVTFPSLRLPSSHPAGCVRLISHLLRAAVPEKIKLTYAFKVSLSSARFLPFVSCIAFAAIMELTKVGKAFPPTLEQNTRIAKNYSIGSRSNSLANSNLALLF